MYAKSIIWVSQQVYTQICAWNRLSNISTKKKNQDSPKNVQWLTENYMQKHILSVWLVHGICVTVLPTNHNTGYILSEIFQYTQWKTSCVIAWSELHWIRWHWIITHITAGYWEVLRVLYLCGEWRKAVRKGCAESLYTEKVWVFYANDKP